MTDQCPGDCEISATDLTITIGVGRLCATSLETFRAVADAVKTPQIERKLEEIALSRERGMAKAIPPGFLDRAVAAYAPAFADQAGRQYQDVRSQLDRQKENKTLIDLYRADQQTTSLLRKILKSVEDRKLTLRLSYLVASFQLSNESLKEFVSTQGTGQASPLWLPSGEQENI